MSRKRTIYSTELKTRLVLEVLKEEKTLNEIASANNVTPKNLQNWKKIFVDNAEMAMEPAKVIKEYKDENSKLQIQLDEYAKVVGKLTVEKDWLSGKLKSLDLSKRKKMVESELEILSIVKQCELLSINRSSLYYEAIIDQNKLNIKNHIQNNTLLKK